MEKRGFIIMLVITILVGLLIGYSYPFYKTKQQLKRNIENSYQSKAWKLYLAKDYDGAIKEFEKYIKKNKNNFFAYSGLGWSYYKKKDYDKAIQSFQTIIELDPNPHESYDGLGLIYYELKDYDKAIEALEKAIELQPSDSILYSKLGKSYYKVGKYQNAVENFEKALIYNPNLLTSKIVLFFIYHETGNEEMASNYLNQILTHIAKNFTMEKSDAELLSCLRLSRNTTALYDCRNAI